MQIFLQVLISVLVAACAWWLIRKMRTRAPAEPADDPLVDPFSDVSAPLKPRPKGRAGAVAIEEPEDDDHPDAYPPRAV